MTPPRLLIDRGELARRAGELSWLLLDVDGVLTDGRLFYRASGELEKAFDVKDGLALALARRSGLKVGLLSGRADAAVARRAQELKLDRSIAGRNDKGAAFSELLAAEGIEPAAVAYAGDDLPDLPVLARCGLSFAPADAAEDVRRRVDVVLGQPGGRGAVRQMVELILDARGEWQALIDSFAATPHRG